ncbi:MAG: hypothetical protein AABW49_00040 [Nanoarchaeota archaeon]
MDSAILLKRYLSYEELEATLRMVADEHWLGYKVQEKLKDGLYKFTDIKIYERSSKIMIVPRLDKNQKTDRLFILTTYLFPRKRLDQMFKAYSTRVATCLEGEVLFVTDLF